MLRTYFDVRCRKDNAAIFNLLDNYNFQVELKPTTSKQNNVQINLPIILTNLLSYAKPPRLKTWTIHQSCGWVKSTTITQNFSIERFMWLNTANINWIFLKWFLQHGANYLLRNNSSYLFINFSPHFFINFWNTPHTPYVKMVPVKLSEMLILFGFYH